MLKNYFKIAWRNILRSKGYSSLNIFGLAAGMSVALIIGLWVFNEYSYDRFLPDYQRLYRVQRNFDSNGDTLTFQSTSLKLADELRRQVPGIEQVAESDGMGSHGLMVGDKKIYLSGAIIGNDFLQMFQYPLLKGNREIAMKDPYSIVLTASTAKAIFGNEDPMNKMVRFDNVDNLKVTGILQDLPGNASLQFNFLVPFSYLDQTSEYVKSSRAMGYQQNSFRIFVKLKPGVAYSQVAPLIRNIEHMQTQSSNAMKSYITLQPLQRWHLYTNYVNGQDLPGFLEYVKMFSIIGFLVLMIACINFVNLATARSEKRAKEVGVRKAIGSQRNHLVLQFLTESFLVTCIAAVLALLIVQFALPSFNTLTQNTIHIPYANQWFITVMVSGIVITSLLAGARPAFYLSSFEPVKVLKGVMKTGKTAGWPRKVLVVMQFSCSVALIISTVIIYQQIEHARSRPAGYDLGRVMSTDLNVDLEKNYTAVKNELLQKGIVASISTSTSPATNIWWHSDIDQFPGKNPNETVEMGTIITGEDYFKTLRMRFADGHDFKNAYDSTSIVFNEAAIKRLRLKNPVGQQVVWHNVKYTIAGVVKDALMISPFSSADPTMFLVDAKAHVNIIYRLSPSIKTEDAIAQLTSVFNRYSPSFPYAYQFADEQYASKFKQEVLIGKLAGIFAVLAIFISSLGLFGLAAYVAEQRTKEIGIRKVLGATVTQVWLLLSKDFIVLVLLSCIIATPVALYFLHGWLQKYDYRISIGPGVFILSALMALIITIITISFQSIKAALLNPVKSLRSE